VLQPCCVVPSPPGGVRRIAVSVSCVCLSSRLSQKPHDQTSRNFLRMLPVAVVVTQSFSEDNTICYAFPVIYFRFCG